MSPASRRRALAATLVAASALAPSAASAFVTRSTDDGAPVRWPSRDVSYVRDRSFVPIEGGDAALATAAQGWSARAKVTLAIAPEVAELAPGLDGKNGIFVGGWAFTPGQLAVTVVSFDDRTGRVLDADVILRDDVKFSPTPTDDKEKTYDLVRILSHELGHSLGLGDELVNTKSVMYLYTRPNDASKRVPTADDVAGIRALYKMAQPDPGAGGCAAGGSFVTGAPVFLGLAAIGALALARRRRLAVVALGLGVGLAATPGAARAGDGEGLRVVVAEAEGHGGIVWTRLELEPDGCTTSGASCPRATAWVPGGKLGAVRQVVSHTPAPAVGDRVRVDERGSVLVVVVRAHQAAEVGPVEPGPARRFGDARSGVAHQ